MSWPKAHTAYRVIVSGVVCLCAFGTYWNRTHPASPIKQKIVQVKQGDGYVTEDQCRQIDTSTKMSDVREKYGAPAEMPVSEYDAWQYPIRDDHKRKCSVSFHEWFGTFKQGNRVDRVTLDLAVD